MKKFRKSLKANSLFIILLIMAFSLVQCDSFCYVKEERFDPREHPLIEKGDTLVFIGSENVDSFYVIESEFYLPHMRYGDEDYEQYYGIMITREAYVDTIIRFDICIIQSLYNLHYYYPFSSYSEPEITGGFIEKSNGGHSLKIASNVLTDIYKVEFGNSLNYPNMFREIDTVYYSKTYGFVKYIKFTGEEFVLSEECLEMLMARE